MEPRDLQPPEPKPEPTSHKMEALADPYAHVLPFEPPAEHVDNSLNIVEEFFQEELSGEMITAIENLPDDQIEDLKDRLIHQGGDSTATFFARGGRLQNATTGYFDHSYILEGEIHLHEAALLEAGVRADIAGVDALKYLALYCNSTLLKDPLSPGNERADWPMKEVIAEGLRQLSPVAPLVRSGCFILEQAIDVTLAEISTYIPADDEHAAWLISRVPQFPPVIKQAPDGTRFYEQPHITEPRNHGLMLVLSHDNPNLTAEELRDITLYNKQLQKFDLSPITSSPIIARGYTRLTQLLLEGSDMPTKPDASLGAAVRYRSPSLSEVSFEDIARLRRNEEIFHDIRDALTTLGETCAQAAIPDSYQSYNRFVREYAEDVVGPTYARLEAIQKKAMTWKAAGFVLGKTLSFGLHAIGKSGVLPGVDKVAGPADKGVQKVVGRKSKERKEVAEIGLRVLKSILPD